MQERIEKLREIAAYLKDDLYNEQLIRTRDSIEEKTFLLTVMGQYSAGKSRLLNNLIGRPILPVHITETTALITEIRYDERERMALFLKDGAWEERPLEEAAKLWQEKYNSEELSRIERITLYINSSLLKNGLILIDTPGVNTIIKAHEKLAEGIITKSDRVLYVMGKSMTKSDEDFINSIRASGTQVLFVRTHVDEIKGSEEDKKRTLAADRADLEKLTEDEIFFVSNDPEQSDYAGVGALRAYLTVHLSERLEKVIQENAAARLDFISGQLGKELFERRMNLSKLLSGDAAVYQEAKEEAEAELKKMEAILEKNKSGMREKYQSLRQKAQGELKETAEAESVKAARKIGDLNLGQNPEDYLPAVEAIVKSGCSAIQDAYLSRFSQMLKDNRKELEDALSNFDGFAGLSGQIPENLEASAEQTQEIAERLRALQLLQEQLTGRMEELAQEQDDVKRDSEKNAMELEELSAARDLVQRQLEEYPPYVAQYITEEGTHTGENGWRKVGALLDVATILIPGSGWLKAGEAVGLAAKGAQAASKAAKAAKMADTALDGLRIWGRIKKNVVGSDPSLLDYLSLEHWFAQIGKKFDKPETKHIDEEHKQRYNQKWEELQQDARRKAEAEAAQRIKILSIKDQQRKREVEREILERKLKAAEEQRNELRREMDAEVAQVKIRCIREFYTSQTKSLLNEFSEYVRKELAGRVDKMVEDYLGTYDFSISVRIRKKRGELEELETRYRSGERTALEQEMAQCTDFAAFLDGAQEQAEV